MSPARDERPTGRIAARDPATPRVTVIVPVYNAQDLIVGCLRSLDEQTLPVDDFQVVVVDDGSSDDTAAAAEAFAARARAHITVIRQMLNKGPAAARNAGLAAARAPVIAFTDSDCEAAADWLERGLARFDAEPEIAGVEGRTDPKGIVGTLTHQMENATGGLWMTCNMLYRREVLDAVGGFDERFRLAFLEDSDVAFGVLDRGQQIAWDPEVIVYHLVLPEGRRKFFNEARKRYYNSLLYSKHPDLYARHLRRVVPGLPSIHTKYILAVLAMIACALVSVLLNGVLWGGFALATLAAAFYGRRVAHAYRARLSDPVSVLQALIHPFVQTWWVIRGAIRFRAFSLKL